MSKAVKTIGDHMRDCRINKGYTQTDIEKATGIPREHISKYEHDWYFPHILSLIDIADFLGVSIDELIGRSKK